MLEKGQLIGNYRILEEIGRGGMGIVYKAQHSRIKEKIMAIKIIHDFIISMPKVVERFKQEANVMYSLRNPNIVYVEDLDEQDGIYFIVMEYVEGESLRQRLQREKIIPVNEALNIALKICQGLEVAHSRKQPIIHRDLKPENILITKDNDIKVTDFGLAKIVGDSNISMMSKLSIGEMPTDASQKKELSIGDLPTDVKDGISQISPGTFAYMSPEQRRAEELDSRTDIYSLGLILYEMLIGELPAGLRPRLPSQVSTEAPKELDEILFRCLETDRKERYSSIIELKTELTEQEKKVVVALEMKKEPPRIIEVEHRPTHLIHPWGMFGHDPQHTGRSPYNGPKQPRLKWKFAAKDRIQSSPTIGADGTIYVGSHDKKLYSINPDGSKKWEFVTKGFVHCSPAIGADGTIYVGSIIGELYSINPDGSEKWTFSPIPSPLNGKKGSTYLILSTIYLTSSPAIGADGTIYMGSGNHKLYAINLDGNIKWEFTTGDVIRSSPAIGTDETIYVGSDDGKLYAINPDGTKNWEFDTRDAIISSPAIGADGTIYAGSHNEKLYAININGSLKWEFKTRGILGSSPAIEPDGTIYVWSDDNNLYALNIDGCLKWKYKIRGVSEYSPVIGADGTIYIGSLNRKLYAINPDGGLKWKFTIGGAILSPPAIGADGTIYVGSRNKKLYAIGRR